MTTEPIRDPSRTAPPAELAADYFDGRSARATPVRLRLERGVLVVEGEGIARRESVTSVQWPERTRHGPRTAHLADGASLHCADSGAWDRWMRAGGRRDSAVVRAQQSWRGVAVALALLVALLVVGYLWALPWAARAIVRLVPAEAEAALGAQALAQLERDLLRPSALPPPQQARIARAFSDALRALPRDQVPAHRLLFRASRIGPNAFALPGGDIVLTDDLVQLVDGDERVIVGVLGHELGHVRRRHGVRVMVQVGGLVAASAVLFGDVGTVMTGLPLLLGQSGYSRDAEREADADSIALLRAAGISPAVMVRFFERVAQWRAAPRAHEQTASSPAPGGSGPAADRSNAGSPREGATRETRSRPHDGDDGGDRDRDRGDRSEPSWIGIAIASHPADAERIRVFQEAAAH